MFICLAHHQVKVEMFSPCAFKILTEVCSCFSSIRRTILLSTKPQLLVLFLFCDVPWIAFEFSWLWCLVLSGSRMTLFLYCKQWQHTRLQQSWETKHFSLISSVILQLQFVLRHMVEKRGGDQILYFGIHQVFYSLLWDGSVPHLWNQDDKSSFLLCFVLHFRALGAERASCNVLTENVYLYTVFRSYNTDKHW